MASPWRGLLLWGSLASAAFACGAPPAGLTVKGDKFVLNGKPFVIRSGEMHYARVPRAYWRDRFKKAKAMGLNTICTYVFWNQHEAKEGKFDFTGNLDLKRYIQIAGEEGLHVIVRPGPYICTELDFGGFPAWLLKNRATVVRSLNPTYLKAAARYLTAVGKIVQPLTARHGGPVIMAQVENEYGSYGRDHVYMAWVRDTMRRAGFDCQLYTSDGPGQDMLSGGTLPDLPATVNFGGGAEGAFRELEKFRPGSPRMIGEYWAGWFDAWGAPHHTTGIEGHLKDIQWCLKNDVSFNLYMFHGGTNFGFMAGSNGGDNSFTVDTTSYDYDSPLDESGRVTPKYMAFRKAIQARVGTPLPQVPVTPNATEVAPFHLKRYTGLFQTLPTPVKSEHPRTFEEMGQAYGLVLYQTVTKREGAVTLSVDRLGDYAIVFVDGKRAGVIDRRKQQKSLALNLPKGGAKVGLLVESLSRVNFGSAIPRERKGIDGEARIDGEPLVGWNQFCLPLDLKDGRRADPRYQAHDDSGPGYYVGVMNVKKAADTFLDVRGWNKGFVWVNGYNLGRFWNIGPQQTLFVPGPWLQKGQNLVIVYDEGEPIKTPALRGLAKPILDQIAIDWSQLHRRPGQKVDSPALALVAEGTFEAGVAWQTASLSTPATGRYLMLEALDDQPKGPYTSLAEIRALDANGKDVPRDKWKVVYADSEEVTGENGSADNVLDNQPTTFWHTEWNAKQPPHPHRLILDLGASTTLAAIRCLPRQDGVNGRIGRYRIYLSEEPFPGQ